MNMKENNPKKLLETQLWLLCDGQPKADQGHERRAQWVSYETEVMKLGLICALAFIATVLLCKFADNLI